MTQRNFGLRRMVCAVLAAAVGLAAGGVRGDVVGDGDVVPTDPGTWSSLTIGYIGNTSDGSVTVDANSQLLSRYGYVGFGGGANGTVAVEGTGSAWTNSSTLYVGFSGNGVISVTGGGKVSNASYSNLGFNAGSTGVVTVDGTGSIWANLGSLTIGNYGAGTLTITNGGQVNNTSNSYLGCTLGYYAGSTGMVTVDGTGSTWNNRGFLAVGLNGTGSLAVTHGGNVSNASGYVGYYTGGTDAVTVDGTGSTWTNSGYLTVGLYGTGSLAVTNGGKVSNTNVGYLGFSNGATGTVTVDGTGSTWTCGSDMYIGNSGSGVLAITNGGLVSVSGTTYVATGSTSTGAIAFGGNGGTLTTKSLFGAPAQFTGTGTINTRGLVSDGALVFDAGHGLNQTVIWSGGYENVAVQLDMTGASGAVGALGAGYQGDGTLTIRDGVAVLSNGGYVGTKAGATGTVTVNGTGSAWTNSGTLVIGNYGVGTLTITDGGQVSNMTGYLGASGSGAGAVVVDGAGSTWSNTSDVYVGNSGAGALAITNSGIVTVGGTMYVANGSASTGTVDFGGNGGTLTTGSLYAGLAQLTGTGTINTRGLVGDGALVFDGSHGLDQTLVWSGTSQNVTVHLDMTRASGAAGAMGAGYQCAGSLTIQDGVSVASTYGYLGYLAGSAGTAAVAGTGSTWTNSSVLSVGNSGAGTLAITGGGKVSNTTCYLGNNTGATGMVTVDGTGSIWTSTSYAYIGNMGAGTLAITNGGQVSNNQSYLGYNPGGAGTASVDGAGSKWTNSGSLSVGSSGTGILAITYGGQVSNTSSCLALSPGTAGTVTVDGAGSMWNNNGAVTIGFSGSGVLTITHGGQLNNTLGNVGSVLGLTPGATGAVTVDGTGSTWNNVGSLTVGSSGTGTLVITGSGKVSNTSGYLGYNTGATGMITVDGTGSMWTNTSDVYVGYSGSGALAITNGGIVTVGGTTYVANGNTSTGGIDFGGNGGTLTTASFVGAPALVTGTGTINTRGLVIDGAFVFDAGHRLNQTLVWSGTSQNVTVHLDMTGASGAVGVLGAGYQGVGTLTIQNISVASNGGYLGFKAGATGVGTVTGAGSMWTNSGSLTIGYFGTGTLAIISGGKVNNTDSYLGVNSGSMGTVTIDGTGSIWTNSGSLTVGHSGTGALAITRGAQVSNTYGEIGYFTGGIGRVTVDGAGSTWTNSSVLDVGNVGAGTLGITNGGKVSSAASILGGSRGPGVVTVDGASSTWTNNGYLYIGGYGAGTLSITNGGKFSSTDAGQGMGYLGDSRNGSGKVMVDGIGSAWTSVSDLDAGFSGKGTLTITNGGKASHRFGYLGVNAGGAGTVSVDGTGSTWTTTSDVYVGNAGAGTLTMSNGGLVTVGGTTYVASGSASTGAIVFGINGGTLTTKSLVGVPGQVAGTGTINTRGLVSDGALVFDAGHGLNQTLVWSGANQNVTVHLDMTGAGGGAGPLGAGYQGAGTLTIQGGVTVSSAGGCVGYKSGATGLATVTGTGATWTDGGSLCLGYYGAGAMAITYGGRVSNSIGYLGYNAGATGAVTVDGTASTWTNTGTLTVGHYGMGTLSITNGAKISSNTSNYSSTGCVLGNFTGSTGTATVDGAGSTWTNSGSLIIGSYGTGTLAMTNGGRVSNTFGGFLGNYTGSAGTVIVDGAGSTMTNAGSLTIGYSGTGTVAVTNGGKVSNTIGFVGFYGSAVGTVRVDGTGSTWTNSGSLIVGNVGMGALTIANGGKVTAVGMSIGGRSTVVMNVGDGSSMSAGTGTLTNRGVIRLKAAANATMGTYTPIVAGSWTGNGTVQALGGTWDTSSHVFTVSAAMAGVPGEGVTINRAVMQRVVITDGTSGDCVVAGFMGTSVSSSVTLTGWAMTEGEEGALVGVLPAGQRVLEGWTFVADGYAVGEPVYLSMKVGSGWRVDDVAVWHFDGSAWTPYTTNDLSYDGAYASFTVTGFSGYAVTGVPEPASLLVVALGAMGLLRRKRRRRGG